ncbi:uncharacterized protein LOC105241294 isoform X4 [Ailuropoda melanoleuca]|uniref:uncharacterized protein LOC105241294 isoform X4 n=1 Tax=Ailuropoda melanoleuca TaxID=9646 RepID=UPI0014941D9F|nr:uncharacterized protein LOC105241294 isoform X4 [Ailuropoda melanoleuca]
MHFSSERGEKESYHKSFLSSLELEKRPWIPRGFILGALSKPFQIAPCKDRKIIFLETCVRHTLSILFFTPQVAQILIGLMKVCLFAIGLCFYSSDLSYRCYPLTMVSGYLIWGSLFVILRVGSCVYRCWEKDDVKPDQRQPGNEHAQCRGWGNRGNHLNSRTDCGSWTGKKVSYSCGVRRVRVPSQDAQSLGKNNDITSVDLEVLHSLEGIRDCNISPLPAGSQHHYLSFCVWVQDDLLCHTGGGYPANQ